MKFASSIGFIVFLVVYSIFKYRAVPELMGQATYIQSTAILVVLTAIVPYLAALLLARRLSGTAKYLAAFLMPLILCVVGLATYFFLFIAPNAPGMSVMQVLPRSIVPGVLMGLILSVPTYLRRNQG